MGDMGDGDGFGPDEGGDAIEMDDTAEMEPGMMEAITLKAAPKPSYQLNKATAKQEVLPMLLTADKLAWLAVQYTLVQAKVDIMTHLLTATIPKT
jgi:hypothetical protein